MHYYSFKLFHHYSTNDLHVAGMKGLIGGVIFAPSSVSTFIFCLFLGFFFLLGLLKLILKINLIPAVISVVPCLEIERVKCNHIPEKMSKSCTTGSE